MYHIAHFAWKHVGGDANYAVCAEAHHGERQRIVARKYREILTQKSAQPRNTICGSGGFFEPNDFFWKIFSEALNGFKGDTHPRSPRDIINNNGQSSFFGDCAEVLIQTFLCRFVV